MIVIFLLIPLSIVMAALFLMGFFWAVRTGQYEDTCTPALRMLAEDSSSPAKTVLASAEETQKLSGK